MRKRLSSSSLKEVVVESPSPSPQPNNVNIYAPFYFIVFNSNCSLWCVLDSFFCSFLSFFFLFFFFFIFLLDENPVLFCFQMYIIHTYCTSFFLTLNLMINNTLSICTILYQIQILKKFKLSLISLSPTKKIHFL